MQCPQGLCLGHKPRKPALGEGINALRVPSMASITLTLLWADNIEDCVSQKTWIIDPPKHQEPHFCFSSSGQPEFLLPRVGEVKGWVFLVTIRTEADMSEPVVYVHCPLNFHSKPGHLGQSDLH